MKVFLYVLIAIGLIGAIATCGDEPSSKNKQKESEKIEYTADMEKTLSLAEYEGWVKMKTTSREMWVDPGFWNVANYDQKLGLAYIGAVKCANELNSDLYYVNIYDNMTGKKLAKWSRTFGFDVE